MAFGLIAIVVLVGVLGIGAIGLFMAFSGDGGGAVIGGIILLGIVLLVGAGGVAFMFLGTAPVAVAPSGPHVVTTVSGGGMMTPGNGVRLELRYDDVPLGQVDALKSLFNATTESLFDDFQGSRSSSKSSTSGVLKGSGNMQLTVTPNQPADWPAALQLAKEAKVTLQQKLDAMGIADSATLHVTDENGVDVTGRVESEALPTYQDSPEPVELEEPAPAAQ